ncbi:MAG TPA: lysylphosphatidylglycerol synthase transmembrane domain-containing protein [Halioglobus sp.]
MNKKFRWLAYTVVITIVAYGIWIGVQDQEEIYDAIAKIGIPGFLFLCLFSTFNYVIRYVRWKYFLHQLGDEVQFWDGLMCYIAGFALTTTPAKAGEVVRSVYFKRRQGISYNHTLSCLLTERTMDALVSALVGILALYTFEKVRWIGVAFTLCIIVVVILISRHDVLLRIIDWMRVIKVRTLSRLLDAVTVFLDRAKELFRLKTFTLGMILGLVAWSAEGLAFAWLAQQLGGQASTLLYVSIFCIALVVGSMTLLPGGLGGTEIVLYMLTVASGLGTTEALTASLLIRLATLWYAVFLGLLSMLWLGSNDESSLPSNTE